MNNTDIVLQQLRILGLSRDESKIYLELLREPTTHLKLAHITGINRTKVYRLAEDLERRSLITKRVDDRGAFLVAADPSTLEVTLVTEEQKLRAQREAFSMLMPVLTPIKQGDRSSFIVQTYDSEEGFKQMLWHELKTKGEALTFGSGTLEDLVGDHRWAEKHRAMTLEAGYKVRELLNPLGKPEHFTDNAAFMQQSYVKRIIPEDVISLAHQMIVYNDTVAIYHWREQQKVGVEIIDKNYAAMQRQVFEHYWELASSESSVQ